MSNVQWKVGTALTKRDDWQHRLTQFIHESRTEGVCLDWENFNCTSWVCDAIEEMTGTDLYEEFRHESKSILSTFQMIKHHGYTSFEAIIDERFNEVPKLFAQRGDLVLCAAVPVLVRDHSPAPHNMILPLEGENPHGERYYPDNPTDVHNVPDIGLEDMYLAAGICDTHMVWSINEHGLAVSPISAIVKAYAVGRIPCHQQ